MLLTYFVQFCWFPLMWLVLVNHSLLATIIFCSYFSKFRDSATNAILTGTTVRGLQYYIRNMIKYHCSPAGIAISEVYLELAATRFAPWKRSKCPLPYFKIYPWHSVSCRCWENSQQTYFFGRDWVKVSVRFETLRQGTHLGHGFS